MQYHLTSHLKYYYLKKGVKCKEKTEEIVFFSYTLRVFFYFRVLILIQTEFISLDTASYL